MKEKRQMFDLNKNDFEYVENPTYASLPRVSEFIPIGFSFAIMTQIGVFVLWCLALLGCWVFFQFGATSWLLSNFVFVVFTIGLRAAIGIGIVVITMLTICKVFIKPKKKVRRA